MRAPTVRVALTAPAVRKGLAPAARALPALVAPAAPVVTGALVLQSAAAVTTTFAEARRAAGAMRGAITTSPPIAVRVGGRSGRGGAGPRTGRDDRQAPRGGNPSRSTRRPGDRGGRG